MSSFGVIMQNASSAHEYMKHTHERLQKKNWITNPFTGGVSSYPQADNKTLYAISITPVYPRFYFLAAFPLGLLLVWPRMWILISAILIASSSYFWSTAFYYPMLRLGIRKHARHAKTWYLTPGQTLTRIIKKSGQAP